MERFLRWISATPADQGTPVVRRTRGRPPAADSDTRRRDAVERMKLRVEHERLKVEIQRIRDRASGRRRVASPMSVARETIEEALELVNVLRGETGGGQSRTEQMGFDDQPHASAPAEPASMLDRFIASPVAAKLADALAPVVAQIGERLTQGGNVGAAALPSPEAPAIPADAESGALNLVALIVQARHLAPDDAAVTLLDVGRTRAAEGDPAILDALTAGSRFGAWAVRAVGGKYRDDPAYGPGVRDVLARPDYLERVLERIGELLAGPQRVEVRPGGVKSGF